MKLLQRYLFIAHERPACMLVNGRRKNHDNCLFILDGHYDKVKDQCYEIDMKLKGSIKCQKWENQSTNMYRM